MTMRKTLDKSGNPFFEMWQTGLWMPRSIPFKFFKLKAGSHFEETS